VLDVAVNRLLVPRAIYDDMIRHAIEVLPDEAVGLLGGADREVQTRIPLPNLLGSTQFLADPHAQFLALRQLAAEGREPVAVYHSHPGGGVRPSEEDLAFARRLPYLQLIIALGRAHNPAVEVAAYAMRESALQEVALDVLSG
jgi:proteasome lid subunit RPN8/RPN11